MIQARMIKVDKNMAELFLSMEKQPERGVQGTNRRFSQQVVNYYAFEMLAGNWRETHQGMAFTGYIHDNSGVFVDGGQRARAVVQAATLGATYAGITYPPNPDIFFNFMVSEGLSAQDVMAMDIGRHRTPGDFLEMQGEVDKNVLASALRLCYLYENVPWSKENWRKHPISPATLRAYLEANPKIREGVAEGRRLHKHMIVSSAVSGWHLAVKAGFEEKVVGDFFDHMFSGANMEEDNAILRLRELLSKTSKKKRRWTRDEQLALLIKAFLKWFNNIPTKNLSFKTDGDHPEAYPRFTN